MHSRALRQQGGDGKWRAQRHGGKAQRVCGPCCGGDFPCWGLARPSNAMAALYTEMGTPLCPPKRCRLPECATIRHRVNVKLKHLYYQCSDANCTSKTLQTATITLSMDMVGRFVSASRSGEDNTPGGWHQDLNVGSQRPEPCHADYRVLSIVDAFSMRFVQENTPGLGHDLDQDVTASSVLDAEFENFQGQLRWSIIPPGEVKQTLVPGVGWRDFYRDVGDKVGFDFTDRTRYRLMDDAVQSTWRLPGSSGDQWAIVLDDRETNCGKWALDYANGATLYRGRTNARLQCCTMNANGNGVYTNGQIDGFKPDGTYVRSFLEDFADMNTEFIESWNVVTNRQGECHSDSCDNDPNCGNCGREIAFDSPSPAPPLGGNAPTDPNIQATLNQQANGGGCVGCGDGFQG